MALSYQLSTAGHEPTELRTVATVTMDGKDAGWAITGIALEVVGRVPGVSADEFRAVAESAKRTCPVSRALAATPITMTAALA